MTRPPATRTPAAHGLLALMTWPLPTDMQSVGYPPPSRTKMRRPLWSEPGREFSREAKNRPLAPCRFRMVRNALSAHRTRTSSRDYRLAADHPTSGVPLALSQPLMDSPRRADSPQGDDRQCSQTSVAVARSPCRENPTRASRAPLPRHDAHDAKSAGRRYRLEIAKAFHGVAAGLEETTMNR